MGKGRERVTMVVRGTVRCQVMKLSLNGVSMTHDRYIP